MSTFFDSIVFILLLLCAGVKAHLSDSCPSVVQGRKIFTRQGTDYSDMMYFWTATYSHGGVTGSGLQDYGGGCYSKNYRKVYFRSSYSSQPSCDGGDGDDSVWWDNGVYTSWVSESESDPSSQPFLLLAKTTLWSMLTSQIIYLYYYYAPKVQKFNRL